MWLGPIGEQGVGLEGGCPLLKKSYVLQPHPDMIFYDPLRACSPMGWVGWSVERSSSGVSRQWLQAAEMMTVQDEDVDPST